MSHEKNAQIARSLRLLADNIEKSPHEYSAYMSAFGGEPRFYALRGQQIPNGFGPIGAALILGDADFVKSHAVMAIDPGRN